MANGVAEIRRICVGLVRSIDRDDANGNASSIPGPDILLVEKHDHLGSLNDLVRRTDARNAQWPAKKRGSLSR